MKPAGRTALGNIEKGRQEPGQRLSGTGRRKDDYILAGQRMTGRLDLMVKPVPATRLQPSGERVRLELWQRLPILRVMRWLNHELYIEPIDTYIDPVRPVDRAIITTGMPTTRVQATNMCWRHRRPSTL